MLSIIISLFIICNVSKLDIMKIIIISTCHCEYAHVTVSQGGVPGLVKMSSIVQFTFFHFVFWYVYIELISKGTSLAETI